MNSSESADGGVGHGAGAPRTRRPCGRAAWRRRRRRGSCSGPRRPARRASARCTTSTPRASRPSRRRPGRPAGSSGVPVGADDDRGGGVVLRREDVARAPADVGAERGQRLDEHGGLDRHVQRAGDARALERLGVGVLLAGRHQAGHLVLGELDLLAAEGGQGEVGDLEVAVGQVRGVVVVSSDLREVGRGGARRPAAARASPARTAASRRPGTWSGRCGSAVEPRLDRVAQDAVAAQAQREADVARGRRRSAPAARAACAGAAARRAP